MNGEQKPAAMSLRWIALCCSAAIAFAAGGLMFFRAHHEIHAKETAHFLRTIAASKAAELAAWVQDQKDDALALQNSSAFLEPLAHHLAGDEMALPKPLQDLLRYVAVSHDVDDVVPLDREGRVRFSLSGRRGVPPEGLEGLREALRTGLQVMTDMHIDPRTESGCLDVAVPIVGGGSSTQPVGGALLVTRASRFIDPMTQAWPVPSATGEVLLVQREEDEVVVLNALRHKPDAALRPRFPLSRQDLPAVMAARGQSGVVHGADYRGVPVTAAITAVKGPSGF
ncbi:hypothetical protein [Desulfosoma sp.]|uniref:hypothetical protein n=1 Tax=Desulfosoma sp. TaxID=2603217 RepID=UPI004048FC95